MLFQFVLLLAQQSVPPQSSAALRELVAKIPGHDAPAWRSTPSGGVALEPALAELRKHIEAGAQLDVECWRTILIEKGSLRWRERWPVDEPFAVALHLPALAQGYNVELRPLVAGWQSARAAHWEMMCGLGEDSRLRRESYQALGPLHPGENTIRLQVIAQPMKSLADSRTPAPVGWIEINVSAVGSINDSLQGVDDDATGREISRLARLFVGKNSEGGNRSWLAIDPATWSSTLSCNLEVQVLRGGEVVSTQWLHFSRREPRRGSCLLQELSPRVLWRRDSSDGWSLRLRGTSKDALQHWDATRYWRGTVEIAVSELLSR